MQYLGGKARIAKYIIPYLNQYSATHENLYSPFCGALNIEIFTDFKNIYCSDINEDLILLWKALQNGYLPPLEVSEQEYKASKLREPSAEKAFIALGCSFSGKWYGGYARDNTGRNYALNAANSLKKKMRANKFFETKFECIDFLTHDWSNIKNSVMYCIPEDTLIYQNGAYAPIQDVIENITDLGDGNVCKKKMVRYTEKELIRRIYVTGIGKNLPIYLSEEHVIFVYNNGTISEVKAKDLKVGDKIIIDFPKATFKKAFPPIIINTINSPYRKLIKLTENYEELSELIGFYAAEGHLQSGLVFSFSHLETEYLNRVKYLINSIFGIEAKIRYNSPHSTVSQTYVLSREIENYFKNFIIGTAINKQLSKWVMELPPTYQLYILKAWMKGDGGFVEKGRNRNQLTGTTASIKLATQMYDIALRCGLRPLIKTRFNKHRAKINPIYDIYFTINRDIATILETNPVGKERTGRHHIGECVITPVNRIETEEFTGNMYDLSTSEGYFWMIGNVKVHNCDSPYENTTGYTHKFDHDKYWDIVRELSKNNIVICSEYKAPSDFECVLEIPTRTDMRTKNGQEARIERLFRLRL